MTTAVASAQGASQTQAGAFTRYRVLIGAVMIQLVLGTVYGYSIFWEPLTAQVFPPVITEPQRQQKLAAGENVSGYTVVATAEAAKQLREEQQGYLKYAFAICILSFALVMVLAGRVQDVKGPRFTAIIGAILMGGGFLVAGMMRAPFVFYLAHAAFTGAVTILLLMLFHALFRRTDREDAALMRYIPQGIIVACAVAGVVLGNQYVGRLGEFDKLFLLWGTVGFLAGAGIGFAYVCPIAALVKWFPQHKGLVSGIAVAGFGFGAYLFKDGTIGALAFIRAHDIVSFFTVHGLVAMAVITLGALLLCNPPGTPPKTAPAESTWQDTLRRPAFYVLWLMFFSGALAGLMVIGIVSPFVKSQLLGAGVDAKSAAAAAAGAVGFLAIFNALGRVVWGFVSDRVGRTATFVAMFLFQTVVMFILGSLKSEVSLAVAASLVGFNFGGNFALFPSATADLFGARNLGANYGWVFTSYGIAGVVGIYAGNIAIQKTGSYQAAFMLAAVMCLISAAMAIGLAVARKRTATA